MGSRSTCVRHIDRLLDELGLYSGLQHDLRRALHAIAGAVRSAAAHDQVPVPVA
jgi:hypothetical protein